MMITTTDTKDRIHSNGSTRSKSQQIGKWLDALQNQSSLTSNDQTRLNAEIHLAISEKSSEYASTICDHLFTLYRHVKHRPFVLQFLPSFITAYYDIRHDHYHHHTESVDATTKDVYSTIDTFLVSLYNLGVTNNEQERESQQIRIPNLIHPSVYHQPNPDHYTPMPFTQSTVSKHDNRPEMIHQHSFVPIDCVNALTRDEMIWFLLIEYGRQVSTMDNHSREAYIQMSKKLIGQGFTFGQERSASSSQQSSLRPTGRRIKISSRILTEILGTLLFFKANSSDEQVSECLSLLKKRAEYELYADVILMTESLSYLHEFETQRPQTRDEIGIEIELPPTVDLVLQKRTATTTRSSKHRHRSHRRDDFENNSETASITTEYSAISRLVLNVVDENSSINEKKNSPRKSLNQPVEVEISPTIDEVRSNISSTIGPARSSPSPSIRHFHRHQKNKHQDSPEEQNPVKIILSPKKSDSEIEETYL